MPKHQPTCQNYCGFSRKNPWHSCMVPMGQVSTAAAGSPQILEFPWGAPIWISRTSRIFGQVFHANSHLGRLSAPSTVQDYSKYLQGHGGDAIKPQAWTNPGFPLLKIPGLVAVRSSWTTRSTCIANLSSRTEFPWRCNAGLPNLTGCLDQKCVQPCNPTIPKPNSKFRSVL